jgi:hydroxypyruvate isomerase
MNEFNLPPAGSPLHRRHFLGGATAAGAAALLDELSPQSALAAEGKAVTKGRIKQSVAFWCFNSAGDKWDLDKTCQVAKELGCLSVELVDPKSWDILKKHGLICAMAPNGMPGAPFMKGFNNPRYHEEVITRTKQALDACAEASFPAVIAFTGYKWREADDPKSGAIPRDEAADHCVKALKQVAGHAEKKGINICLEHLNTRDDSHPMKGHPGYQGDDLDWVAKIIRGVGSKRVRLLFDVYHVQIMHGDVIRRLEQNKDILGHVHTAGNPGRGELDDKQEINYPAIMKKLVDLKYTGYVGQEFIPTRNPLEGLREAVHLCDV